mmetsp:Transcript_16973/g.35028  ORF Transcript_16973/g.35028 Transcript_16973/m.35028 type:complete len:101 (-) Transcript_16973:77-379(-)
MFLVLGKACAAGRDDNASTAMKHAPNNTFLGLNEERRWLPQRCWGECCSRGEETIRGEKLSQVTASILPSNGGLSFSPLLACVLSRGLFILYSFGGSSME